MKRYVSTWAPVCALIAISLALISCGKKDTSTQSLPNPESTAAALTTGFDAVVMVSLPNGSGICTGTFISTKAVLTAAHCAKKAGRYVVSGNLGSFSTYTVVTFGAGVVDDPNDIALLIFDRDVVSASQIYHLAAQAHSGDELRLVGYGCNNLTTKLGAGVKRTGTNVVASVSDYVEFITPSSTASTRGILGASNRAGSCFGDSGGPALKASGESFEVSAVTHAGGYDGDSIISQYVDLNRSDNRAWLASQNSAYNLGISGL